MIATPLILTAVLQTIWIVDAANGPGTNFTNLPPAVAAAVSGDIVIVRPGAYAPFVVSGKALTIRGSGATTTTVAAAISSAQTVIASVPTGSVFYLSGIGFAPAAALTAASPDPAVRVSGAGEVVLSDASLLGFNTLLVPGAGSGNPALTMDGGAVVHVTRCSITGGGSYLYNGGPGAIVGPGCRLAADGSTFTGGVGWFGFGAGGGQGVLVQGGFATLSRCSAYGGNYGIPGSAVAVVQSGFARIAGNAATVLQGGTGGVAYSVFADATSSAIVHGPVTLTPPTSGAVTTGALPLPYASITGTPAGGGELQAALPVTVTFEGLPLAPCFCVVDTAPSFSTAFAPLLIGELLVPVPLAFALEGTLPASGSLQFSVTPLLVAPSLANLPVYLQIGVVDSVAGNMRMSNGLVRVFKN